MEFIGELIVQLIRAARIEALTMKNRRWACAHCGMSGWDVVGSYLLSGRFDHDRADGLRCRMAERAAPPREEWTPNWVG